MHRLLISKFIAKPLIKPYIYDQHHIKKEYKGDQDWFTTAVYVARKRWKRFLQTVKYDGTRQGKDAHCRGYQGVQLLNKATICANIEWITLDDKKEAKDLLDEYYHYKKNMPDRVKPEGSALTGYVKKTNFVNGHMRLTDTEIEAEYQYHIGNIKKAMRIVREEFQQNEILHGSLDDSQKAPNNTTPDEQVEIKVEVPDSTGRVASDKSD